MLVCYNKTTSAVPLDIGTYGATLANGVVTRRGDSIPPVLPASALLGARSAATDVTEFMRNRTAAQYLLAAALVAAGTVEFQWTGSKEYETPGLSVGLAGITPVTAATETAHTHARGTLAGTSAFAGTAMPLAGSVVLVRPDAAGTDLGGGGFHAADEPNPRVEGFAKPDYARNLRLTTEAGTWVSTAAVEVTITGKVRGVAAQQEVITIPADTVAGTSVAGLVPFDEITSVAWTAPAGWTAGHFLLEGGAALGLPLPAAFAALTLRGALNWDETASPPNPAADAGTVNAANGTFTPGTAADASHSYAITYDYTKTPAGAVTTGIAGSTAAGSAHAHTLSMS